MTLERQNMHAHGVNAAGDGTADVAVAHDADGLAGDLFHIELFPAARFLVAEHAAKILGKVENRGESEFAQRRREDAATVGERNRALDEFRKENACRDRPNANGPSAHCRQARNAERRRSREPAQCRITSASLRGPDRASAEFGNGMRQIRKHAQLRIGLGSAASVSTRIKRLILHRIEIAPVSIGSRGSHLLLRVAADLNDDVSVRDRRRHS